MSHTSSSRLVRQLRCGCVRNSWLLVLCILVLPSRLPAIGGFMDNVVIMHDMTYPEKRADQEMQFDRVVTELEKIIEQNNEQLRRMGSVSSSAPSMVGSVSSVTDPTAAVLAVENREKTLEMSAKENTLRQTRRKTIREDKKVGPSYKVLGDTRDRDETRYASQAMQEALRQRQADVIEAQDKALQSEFSQQRELLGKLRAAKTETEIQTLQAALTASQQRIELVRQKTEQARDDCTLFDAQLAIEADRKRSADEEWANGFVEKLRDRALTAFHAQKG